MAGQSAFAGWPLFVDNNVCHGARSGVYQTLDAFLQQVFNSDIPDSELIWIKDEVRQTIADILGYKYSDLRVSYWQRDDGSAWTLNEIGKEQAITFGCREKFTY